MNIQQRSYSPAKGVGRQKRREGSNPSHSAKSSGFYEFQLKPELFSFILFRKCFRFFVRLLIKILKNIE